MTWRPIDSAPRDGTPILACSTYANRSDIGAHPRTVRREIYHPNAPGEGTWRNKFGHKENFLTHWMPMMDSPKETK